MKQYYGHKGTFWFVLFLIWSTYLSAQVTFEQSRDVHFGGSFHSENAISTADVNGDGYDDIVGYNSGQIFVTLLSENRQVGLSTSSLENLGTVWNIIVGDINNNGRNEIVISFFDSRRILILEYNGYELIESQRLLHDMYPQGANLSDINNDGWLDLFVCNDIGPNVIYYNDGNGLLLFAEILDYGDIDIEMTAGNYSSEWCDIDLDGDKDLYISKCYSSANTPDDKRRINQLYINDNNELIEQASSFNLASGIQSWVSEIEDFDNDGDFDVYVVNHNEANQLFENKGNNRFEEITGDIPLFYGFPNNAQSADFDNNGYVDIFIGGGRSDHAILWNYGNFNFEIESFNQKTNSSAIGDINRDGFIDLYTSYQLVGQSGPPNSVLLNKGNRNNYISCRLNGIESNKNGIGAILKLYSKSNAQLRELKAGEGYGIMNSLNVHFGLGEDEEIDSLVIDWPSGIKQVIVDIDVNMFYTITEGKCITTNATLAYAKDIICGDERLTLQLPAEYAGTAQWSQESKDVDIEIDDSGVTHLQISDSDQCLTQYDPVSIIKNPQQMDLEIIPQTNLACNGEEVILGTNTLSRVEWNDDIVATEYSIRDNGIYIATTTQSCTVQSDTILYEFVNPIWPNVMNDTVPAGELAMLTSSDENTYWYHDETSTEVMSQGSLLEIEDLQEDTTVYASSYVNIESPTLQQIGLELIQENVEFHIENINGGLDFTAIRDFKLESVDVFADAPGIRIIRILDKDDNVIFERDIFINEGRSRIEINHLISKGEDYFITTSTNQNQISFGYNSPSLAIHEIGNESSPFPYTISNLVSIHNSSFSELYYPYFFNWNVREVSLCESIRVPVSAIVEGPSHTSDADINRLSTYPNPVTNYVILDLPTDETKRVNIILFDALGNRIDSFHNVICENQIKLDMLHYSSGLYIIHIVNVIDNSSFAVKVLK